MSFWRLPQHLKVASDVTCDPGSKRMSHSGITYSTYNIMTWMILTLWIDVKHWNTYSYSSIIECIKISKPFFNFLKISRLTHVFQEKTRRKREKSSQTVMFENQALFFLFLAAHCANENQVEHNYTTTVRTSKHQLSLSHKLHSRRNSTWDSGSSTERKLSM